MVGKEPKSSRIFQQCYLKCCKLQNLTPLTAVLPSANGKVDFCVDRIKYADWPPLLNALSCDLSLHAVGIKCRQQVKTVLEHIDCERLAKTVNKRAVILTNFMLSNLVEALSQLLCNTTLLNSLLLEGLPLRIPYLNPLNEALLSNSSLQHLYLPRCLIGDAGCLALCKSVRCLPNLLTLDLSGCEVTLLGASYIADLIKYQKIHRYSENWVHTLRYRLPDLDTMAGLRRITLCGNVGLGDAGVNKLLEVLADDLWIKALDVQNCGVSEAGASNALQILGSNTTLVVLDLRHNPEVSSESLANIRAALRGNERGKENLGQYVWLNNVCSSTDRLGKPVISKNVVKDRVASNTRNAPIKYANKPAGVKKEKDYTEELLEQLQEETSHRRQLEELNLQLVQQMKELKQQQMRMWTGSASSGSLQSFEGSSRSCELSASSSSGSVPVEPGTLAYIQHAFRDIYAFIKDNQCQGRQCIRNESETDIPPPIAEVTEDSSSETELRTNMIAKKAHSTHVKLTENVKVQKTTKSAHYIGESPREGRHHVDVKPDMFERHMGDTQNSYGEPNLLAEMIVAQKGDKVQVSPCSSIGTVSDSSSTLVCSRRSPRARPPPPPAPHPRDALCSSDDSDED